MTELVLIFFRWGQFSFKPSLFFIISGSKVKSELVDSKLTLQWLKKKNLFLIYDVLQFSHKGNGQTLWVRGHCARRVQNDLHKWTNTERIAERGEIKVGHYRICFQRCSKNLITIQRNPINLEKWCEKQNSGDRKQKTGYFPAPPTLMQLPFGFANCIPEARTGDIAHSDSGLFIVAVEL